MAAAGLYIAWWLYRVAARKRWPRTEPDEALQAAYQADRAMRVTCEHLRPIEDEAREQGAECILTSAAPPVIFIRALDPGPEAMAPLHLPACVRHEHARVIGPHSWSDPTYRCTLCGCAVEFHQGGFGRDPAELAVRARPA